jgi:hypothetical protein
MPHWRRVKPGPTFNRVMQAYYEVDGDGRDAMRLASLYISEMRKSERDDRPKSVEYNQRTAALYLGLLDTF